MTYAPLTGEGDLEAGRVLVATDWRGARPAGEAARPGVRHDVAEPGVRVRLEAAVLNDDRALAAVRGAAGRKTVVAVPVIPSVNVFRNISIPAQSSSSPGTCAGSAAATVNRAITGVSGCAAARRRMPALSTADRARTARAVVRTD